MCPKRFNKRFSLLLFVGALLALAACDRATPIPVYVTPTPERTFVPTAELLTPSLTAVAALPTTPSSPSPYPTVDPNATFGPIAGFTPTATATGAAIAAPPSPTATGTAFGPAVPTDYTVSPTVTPSPTITPTLTSFPTFDPNASFGPIVSPGYTLSPSETPTTTPGPTLTASPTPFPLPTNPPVTFGPAVPPNYTLPPSPTRTPVPSVTASPTSIIGLPTPTPIPLPTLDANEIGIQIHPLIAEHEWRDMLSKAERLNVGWIKVQFSWKLMEPEGPGSRSQFWHDMERYVADARNAGFRVMVSIAKAPTWARVTNEEDGPPTDPQFLVNFIQTILDQYGPNIDAIEVWNEPNLLREWRGAPINGTQYMRLFAPAYETITAWSRANGHPIQVITAGLAPTGDSQYSVDDRNYLQQMYRAGLANYRDVALGIHPYAWGNAPDTRCCDPIPDRSWDDSTHFFFLENVEAYRAITMNNGHASAQLWPTEFGWPTYDGFGYVPPQQFFNYVDEALQANYTIQALDIIQNSGAYDYVGPMMLWNLNFAIIPNAVAEGSEMAGYSLLRPDGSERPLYHYLHLALNN